MKNIKLMVTTVIVLAAMSVSGQWTDNGNYSNTMDRILIGHSTDNSLYQLNVTGKTSFTGGAIDADRLKSVGSNGVFKFGWGAINGADAVMYSKTHSTEPGVIKFMYGGAPSIGNFNIINFDGTSYLTRFFINTEGQTGIGTNNPEATLDVIGDIKAESIATNQLSVNGKIVSKEVEVTLDGWPDYVFEDEYDLKALSELELFIKENKHLPGVPNEKQITENGVSLGEMNKILMEKVEELTLYVIQLQKEIDSLK